VSVHLFDAATILVLYLLLRKQGRPPHAVLVYAWNPCVLLSFPLFGHLDSLAIVTLFSAYLFLEMNWGTTSVVALALSALSKFFAVVLLPVFLRKTGLRKLPTFLAVMILFCLPYASIGLHIFGGLSNFSRDWENNDSVFHLIRWIIPSKQNAEWFSAALLAALLGYAVSKTKSPLAAGLILTGRVLLLSPNAFPWYFTWLVPYLCFFSPPSWLLMTITSVLGYAPVVTYAAGQEYRDSPLLQMLEYLLVIAVLGYEVFRNKLSPQRGVENVAYAPKAA
jgi:alpha-1,6-mannosyltransferase